jgi:urease alpha subunit
MIYSQANPAIVIDPASAEVTIDGEVLPSLPTDLPLNRRYLLR